MPLRFDCVLCGGKGCKACQEGVWELNQCPHEFIDHETGEVLKFARFARDGSWPVAGGMMDQSPAFVDACRLIWNEQDIIEAEILKRG